MRPTSPLAVGIRRPTPAILLATLLSLHARIGAQNPDPPPISILQSGGSPANGYIFVTAAAGSGPSKPLVPYSNGPEIVDNQGRPVWYLPLAAGGLATDLRVQTYQGQPVLTWSQGIGFEVAQPGATVDYIADQAYHVIATVQAGNGMDADQHEFRLTPQNTALITIYSTVQADLTSAGGSASAKVLEGVVQEIDVVTGNVLLEWHSLDHVDPGESYVPVPASPNSAYDYFHVNSASLDTDGNLLISARHTWTVYKVNRITVDVIWRLGGKKSDFALGPGLPFAWQHDAEAVDSGTIRIFDNESNGTPVLPASRVVWVTHDEATMTASLARSIQHPAGLLVSAEGNGQPLDNGGTFVGWGVLGRFSEFDPNGLLLFDASLPQGFGSYRAYRFPWAGMPDSGPAITALLNADGSIAVHAIWNGATRVASWQVMGGASAGSLGPVASAAWNGLDTAITVTGRPASLQAVALDSAGSVIGQSATLSGPFASAIPAMAAQPASQTISEGTAVVFSVRATGGALAYQWSFNGGPVSDGALAGATISGATRPNLVVSGATSANAGSYTCLASNSAGSVSSSAAMLATSATADVGRLVNVSCRARVGTGADVLITGFAVGGAGASGPLPVLVRANGPSLAQFGVPDPMADPELQLFGALVGAPLASNSGWSGSADVSEAALVAGAFSWGDPASLDSAVVQSLAAGPYTAEITGDSGDSGVALAEVYDTTPAGAYAPSLPRLVNVSARAVAGTGSDVLAAGFVIGGSTSRTVLVRAAGPALAQFGLSGTLPDPALQLYNVTAGSVLLASNSGWGADPTLAAAASWVGAFSWGGSPTPDSAILVTLAPGAYTAQVSGADGDRGVALIEIYELP